MEKGPEEGQRSSQSTKMMDENPDRNNVPNNSSTEATIVAEDSLLPNDIICGGLIRTDENEKYLSIINGWWEAYERSGHTEKRNIADAAVRELLAAGFRFLVPVKNRPSGYSYSVLPDDSMKIKDKVKRRLRKIIRANTLHLNPKQAKERMACIKALRSSRSAKGKGIAINKGIPTGGSDTWDGIWENGKTDCPIGIQPKPSGPILSHRADCVMQPTAHHHEATFCSARQQQLLLWSNSIQGRNVITAPTVTDMQRNALRLSLMGSHPAAMESSAGSGLQDLQDYVPTRQESFESDNLDLSNVFDDDSNAEAGAIVGFSSDTLVCPHPQGSSNDEPLQMIQIAEETLMNHNRQQVLGQQQPGNLLLEALVAAHAREQRRVGAAALQVVDRSLEMMEPPAMGDTTDESSGNGNRG